jgi:hypothetical protein
MTFAGVPRSQHGSGGPDARRRAEDTEDKKDSHTAEDEDPRQVPRHDRGEDTADRQDGAGRTMAGTTTTRLPARLPVIARVQFPGCGGGGSSMPQTERAMP